MVSDGAIQVQDLGCFILKELTKDIHFEFLSKDIPVFIFIDAMNQLMNDVNFIDILKYSNVSILLFQPIIGVFFMIYNCITDF